MGVNSTGNINDPLLPDNTTKPDKSFTRAVIRICVSCCFSIFIIGYILTGYFATNTLYLNINDCVHRGDMVDMYWYSYTIGEKPGVGTSANKNYNIPCDTYPLNKEIKIYTYDDVSNFHLDKAYLSKVRLLRNTIISVSVLCGLSWLVTCGFICYAGHKIKSEKNYRLTTSA